MKLFGLLLLFIIGPNAESQNRFIHLNKNQFFYLNRPYSYLGTNYWYGPYLAADENNSGYKRLCYELDYLKSHGINNLRVLLSGEGDSSYPFRISPSVQEKPYQYNETILKSFDIFLNEAAKRNMKLICVLNNNWEWSGGFGQYLDWAGYKNPILPKTTNWNWENYCEYVSQFYGCDSCQIVYKQWIEKIINRKNTINHRDYKNDETIMAWQLANEPRPMKDKVKQQYKQWIETTANYIKSIDTNHLISIGVEGIIGTSLDTSLYIEIHSIPSIDYATIHLWPKTWNWYNGHSEHSTSDSTLDKTKNYIALHSALCKKIKKPLVIEEFGLHRDHNRFKENTSVAHRNHYYEYIISIGKANGVAGYNFWGAFGYRDTKLTDDFWKKGLPYSADPPQEEQGLYGVYKTDTSTWKILQKIIKDNSFR